MHSSAQLQLSSQLCSPLISQRQMSHSTNDQRLIPAESGASSANRSRRSEDNNQRRNAAAGRRLGSCDSGIVDFFKSGRPGRPKADFDPRLSKFLYRFMIAVVVYVETVAVYVVRLQYPFISPEYPHASIHARTHSRMHARVQAHPHTHPPAYTPVCTPAYTRCYV